MQIKIFTVFSILTLTFFLPLFSHAQIPDTSAEATHQMYTEAYDYYCTDSTYSQYKKAALNSAAELKTYCSSLSAYLNDEPGDNLSQGISYDSDIEQIEKYDVMIKVNADASIDVQETILYNFGSESKHGIYRDVPIVYRTKSGTKMNLDLKNIRVTDEQGRPYQYTTSREGNDRRIKIGDPDKLITGVHTYAIEYTVPHAVGFFDTFDEIYWNAVGTGWEVPVMHAEVSVELPYSVNSGAEFQNQVKRSCYVGSAGSSKSCDNIDFEHDSGYNIVVGFQQNTILDPHEGLTVAVGFPKGIVTEPTALERTARNFFNGGWYWLILPILVFIWRYRHWSKYGRDPKGTGVIVSQYEAPEGLSPMQIAFILKQSFGSSLSAEIVYLATRGFLKISKVKVERVFSSSDDYELEKLKPADSTLAPFQVRLLDGLFAPDMASLTTAAEIAQAISSVQNNTNASRVVKVLANLTDTLATSVAQKKLGVALRLAENKVKLSDLRDRFYPVVSKIERDCESSLVEGGYFPAGKTKTGNATYTATIGGKVAGRSAGIIVGAIFLIFFGSMFLGVFSGGNIMAVMSYVASVIVWVVFQILMFRMTEKGVLTKERIKGFKLYLSVAEKDRIDFHNAPPKNPAQFEKFLPYAMALGVEKEWAKIFEGLSVPQPSWYSDSSMTAFSAGAFAGSMSSFSTASSSSLGSSPGSSSGSGGGGSSGGGGGGGGGGSW